MPKTSKSRQKNKKNKRRVLRKSVKNVPPPKNDISNAQKSRIMKTFLEILHTIKLYHWKTASYSQHKATDELHEKLSEQTDRFVEVLIGKHASRVDMVEAKMKLYDFDNKHAFKEKVFEFREFLIDLDLIFNKKKDSDLMTIKDDMLENVNQFLYLFTLSG